MGVAAPAPGPSASLPPTLLTPPTPPASAATGGVGGGGGGGGHWWRRLRALEAYGNHTTGLKHRNCTCRATHAPAVAAARTLRRRPPRAKSPAGPPRRRLAGCSPSARHACIETLRVGGIKWRDARGTMRQCRTLNPRFENDSLAGMHTTSILWLNR